MITVVANHCKAWAATWIDLTLFLTPLPRGKTVGS